MLDKTSVRILKLLKSKGSLTLKEIEEHTYSRHAIMDNIKLLEDNDYILNLRGDAPFVLNDDGSIEQFKFTVDVYKLMPLGKAHLEYVSKDRFRFWLPIIISAIALVISAIALVASWQTIVTNN